MICVRATVCKPIFTGEVRLSSWVWKLLCVDWMECKRRLFEKRGFSSCIHPCHFKVWWFQEMVNASIMLQRYIFCLNISSWIPEFYPFAWSVVPFWIYSAWIIVLHLTGTVLILRCSYTYRACLEETEQYWRGWYE